MELQISENGLSQNPRGLRVRRPYYIGVRDYRHIMYRKTLYLSSILVQPPRRRHQKSKKRICDFILESFWQHERKLSIKFVFLLAEKSSLPRKKVVVKNVFERSFFVFANVLQKVFCGI